MIASRDHRDEMHVQRELDDATVQGVVRGGPVPADLEPLAAALSALRTHPEQPVRASASLAARMATGDVASAAAPRPTSRRAGRHAARCRLAALPLRAKIAVGSVPALGGPATAQVAGALPDTLRCTLVIEIVTAFEFAEPSDFGRDVSDDAQGGGVDGQDISEQAQEQGYQPDEPQADDLTKPEAAPPHGGRPSVQQASGHAEPAACRSHRRAPERTTEHARRARPSRPHWHAGIRRSSERVADPT